MRHFIFKTAVLAAMACSFVTTNSATAAPRTQGDLLRVQVVRLHGRLAKAALDAPEVIEAHSASARAWADLYQIRENLLADLRKQDDYADLKLALWTRQQLLQGQHQEVPVRIATILMSATDAMSIRTQIGKLETAALEGSEEYVAARDTLNALVAAERQIIASALDGVRNDPEFVSLTQQLQSVQHAYSRRSMTH